MEDENNKSRPNAEAQPGRGFIQFVGRHRGVAIAVLLLAAAGATLSVALFRGSGSEAGRPVPKPSGELGLAPAAVGSDYHQQPGELLITIAPELLANAQIKSEPVVEQTAARGVGESVMRTTGTVQSNAYREVPVLPIAGGIVREVKGRLGDQVTLGQPLATIFSTDLADAQTAYLKSAAELAEHHQHHKRATELVELGAASREELEQATTSYKTAEVGVSMARQRLLLLGLTEHQIEALRGAGQINSMVAVGSPISGTVISRTVNAGEVVAVGRELFRVADLSTVWVIGQVFESDFKMARVGMAATITTPALPGRSFTGRVDYVDPRVDPQTRTAQVRIEVQNPRGAFKLGMFVDVGLGAAPSEGGSGPPAVTVPSAAVQYIGSRAVVYVAMAQPGLFAQREIVAGPESNGLVTVLSGVSGGERVVTTGGFLLRTESLKVNPAQLGAAGASKTHSAESAGPTPSKSRSETRTVTIEVTETGYQPASFTLESGVPARLVFVRRVEQTCGTTVVIPEFNIKRELPLNEPVILEVTPKKRGEYSFTCGMNMLTGKIIVK